MSQSALDLNSLFGAALQAVTSHRQEINDLDGYNGNHGDNMVENLRMITDALQANKSQPPAEALRYAGQKLQSQGRGGTSQYYARGLNQAAERLQGQALMSALMGGRVNPLQAGTPRAAAGSLVAQSILQALAGRR